MLVAPSLQSCMRPLQVHSGDYHGMCRVRGDKNVPRDYFATASADCVQTRRVVWEPLELLHRPEVGCLCSSLYPGLVSPVSPVSLFLRRSAQRHWAAVHCGYRRTSTLVQENTMHYSKSEHLTWRLGWQSFSSSVCTRLYRPLLTAMCSAVWRRLLRAFGSAPAWISCTMTAGSSPWAAWCTARSPSLSCRHRHQRDGVQYMHTAIGSVNRERQTGDGG